MLGVSASAARRLSRALFLAAPLAATLAGCATRNLRDCCTSGLNRLRGEGFADDAGSWMGRVRPSDSSTSSLGFSSKAKQIERGFGIE
jgi:hypothetical protein